MKNKNVALITGITGQDGSYLAELLLEKGYSVHGFVRSTSTQNNTVRISHLLNNKNLTLHNGELTDSASVLRVVDESQPTEIYNLAAQSHVGDSFGQPEHTAEVTALGPLRLLEAVRHLNLTDRCKFYQASTSELFGEVKEIPQKITTPFHPRSPYGVAKIYAYWLTVNYRESYGMFACNGVLFNHESPRRGETFVTRKITKTLAKIAAEQINKLSLGNLDAKRDWGHAKEYVKAQWLLMQLENPTDVVIATGDQRSVREFVNMAAAHLGIELEWRGSGLDEVGIVVENHGPFEHIKVGSILVDIDPRYYRPGEVDTLLGCPDQARQVIGWKATVSIETLASEMMASDLREVLSG